MGFPWLCESGNLKEEAEIVLPVLKDEKADFLFEIGSEELPASDLDRALEQLETAFGKWLVENRLGFGAMKVEGTPRRQSVLIKDLQTCQEDRSVEIKGPPADRAFDADGRPTKVAEGFARSRGLDVSQLGVKEFDNGRYVVVQMEEKGQTSMDLLAKALPGIIADLKFTKSMRWNASGANYSRPIRWLLAILGGQVVPFSYAGLQSGNLTRGLRFASENEKAIDSLKVYEAYLQDQGIILDPNLRREIIWQEALKLAESVDGTLALDQDLLAEIGNLVEQPTALLGTFDPRYLQSLPPEVLIAVMKKHQRYIPVLDKEGKLTNHFIIVRNGDAESAELVVDGNLQVILARFADAEFFVHEDMKKKIEDFVPKLSQLTFQKELGSMLDKTRRIERLTVVLAEQLDLDEEQKKAAARIAQLSKADLASEMVVEMTALQGVMGKYYARNSVKVKRSRRVCLIITFLARRKTPCLRAKAPWSLVWQTDWIRSLVCLRWA